MEIGKINRARVDAIMPQGFYLELETGGRILLPGNKNQFTNRIGAFLDWGLNKDLLLPYKQQLGELQRGDKCVVYVLLDEKSGRLVATEKIKSFLDTDTSELHIGERVELAAYEVTPDYVDFLVNYRYTGRLMVTRGMERIYIGDTMTGYIQRFTSDGKITLNLSPVGYKGIMNSESPAAILQKLEEAGGSLPYGDHSDPEIIRQEFGVSKKTFKKILGTLFREGKIILDDDGFRLP